MAIKIDYRIVDDAEGYADVSLFASVNEDDDTILTLNQDGSEISVTIAMAKDLIETLQTLSKPK